jgi:hypothetical protein
MGNFSEYLNKQTLNEGKSKKITLKLIKDFYTNLFDDVIIQDEKLNEYIFKMSNEICNKLGLDPSEDSGDGNDWLQKVGEILYPSMTDHQYQEIVNDLNEIKLFHDKK